MTQGAVKSLRRVQVGKETTRGTEVPATAKLIGEGVLAEASEFVRPEGDYGVLSRAVENPIEVALASQLDFSTDLSYQQLLYALHAGVKGAVTPAEQTMGQGDFKYTFGSPVAADPVVDTFTLEGVARDGAANIEQFTAVYGFVTEFGLSAAFGANLAQHTAQWMAKSITAKAPAADPGNPVRNLVPADKFDVKFASTQAGLTAAGILTGIVNAFDLSIITGMTAKRRLSGSTEWVEIAFGPWSATLSLTLDLINTTETQRASIFRTGTDQFIRLSVEGAQIAAGVNQRIQFDMAGHILEPPTPGDEEGQETREVTFEAFHDTVWGFGYEFQVTTNLAALP